MASRNVGSLRTSEYDAMLRVLRRARTRSGVSQEQLSKRLTQSITYIVKVETGTRRLDLIEYLSICKEIDQDPLALMSEIIQEVKALKPGKD